MRTVAALALVFACAAHAGVLYNFTSFDGPGSNAGGTTVNGINNNGVTVGFSSDNAATPTLFTNFTRDPNGLFGLLNLAGDPLAMSNGVNDSLNVVGGFSNGTAFETVGGNPLALPAVNSTTATQTAFGISDTGLIVGQFTDNATGTTPGYLLKNGAYTILNPIVVATVTNAQGVNNNGLVTGFYSVDGVHQHGFFYNSATQAYTLAPDPNIPNLVLTQFLGINDHGIVSGYYQLPDGSQHGLLYDSNTKAYSFLDDPNAAISGFSITQITGIDNAGDLAGFYVDGATGKQRGFVATVVPEPGTFGMLLTLLLPVVAVRWSRLHALHRAPLRGPNQGSDGRS